MHSRGIRHRWRRLRRKLRKLLNIERRDKKPGQYRTPKIHKSILREDADLSALTYSQEEKKTVKSKPNKKPANKFLLKWRKDTERLRKKKRMERKLKRKEEIKTKVRNKRKRKKRKEKRVRMLQKYFPFLAVLGIIPFPKDAHGDELKQKVRVAFFYYFLNSTALFILAYLIVSFFYQLTVLITASMCGLDATWYYYDLAFNDLSPLWHRSNILFITFSGPFVSLVIGFIFYYYFSKKKKLNPYLRLFYVWMALHGLNQFFGAFASGVAFDEGFGYVPIWLYWAFAIRIFVSIVMLSILAVYGYYATQRFLNTSNSLYRIRRENRQYFLLNQAVLPAIIGGLIIFLVKLPKIFPYEIGLLVVIAIATIPTLFNLDAKPNVKIPKDPKNQTKIRWAIIILSLVVLVGFRILFANGIHIVLILKFAISITPL